MTRKVLYSILILGFLSILAYEFLKINKETRPEPNYKELIEHIDSLNNELNILKSERDSLYNRIDSSKVKVTTINNWYEKELINITNQPIASDVVFFSEYLSKNSK